jgi:hypothetical protein
LYSIISMEKLPMKIFYSLVREGRGGVRSVLHKDSVNRTQQKSGKKERRRAVALQWAYVHTAKI